MKLKNTPKSYWASGKQYSTENYHSDVGDGEKCYANNNSSGGGIPWDNEKRQAFILMLTLGGNTPQNVAECVQRNVEKNYTWDQLNLLPQDFLDMVSSQCNINPNMGVGGLIPWDNEKRQAFILMLTLGGNTPQNVAECFQRNVEKYYTWDQLNLLTQDFYTYLYNKCDINPNMDVRGDLGTPARSPQSPTTPPPPPPDKGLPVGAIIGIIICALIVLALILLLMHKKVSV
jgi:hypothetical protein